MVLYIVSLGLGDEKDITFKGYEAITKSSAIYLENYTSILGVSKSKLEEFYKKPIIEADRYTMESGIDEILDNLADKMSIDENYHASFLVVGDCFAATTHTDFYLRAIEKNIKVEVIHNASIVNSVGCCGMQIYRFGEIISIPFFTEKWRPYSFYDKIINNLKNNLHTLCLLDIQMKEQTVENILKGNKIYEPPRFMSTQVAAEQLLEIVESKNDGILKKDTKCFGLARVGQPTQKIVAASLEELKDINMGEPLHCLVICSSELHEMEQQFYKLFSYNANL